MTADRLSAAQPLRIADARKAHPARLHPRSDAHLPDRRASARGDPAAAAAHQPRPGRARGPGAAGRSGQRRLLRADRRRRARRRRRPSHQAARDPRRGDRGDLPRRRAGCARCGCASRSSTSSPMRPASASRSSASPAKPAACRNGFPLRMRLCRSAVVHSRTNECWCSAPIWANRLTLVRQQPSSAHIKFVKSSAFLACPVFVQQRPVDQCGQPKRRSAPAVHQQSFPQARWISERARVSSSMFTAR